MSLEGKTVNASVVITRDGQTTAQNFPNMGYATFVALQSSLSGVLSMLQSWGSIRVADLAEGREERSPGGNCDLRLTLSADHGGGTSEVSLAYTGISEKDADETTAALLGGVSAVVGQK